jgi:hypothetical protein
LDFRLRISDCGFRMNISHLRCGPVGVRFIESRFAGRHKCRPYKDLKRKFLYYLISNDIRSKQKEILSIDNKQRTKQCLMS